MAKYNETIKTSQFTYKDGVLTINEGSEGWYDFRESVFDVRDSDDVAFEKLTNETREIVIPSSWGGWGEETFAEFEDSPITCLNLMNATGLQDVGISYFLKLRVVVLPKHIDLSEVGVDNCPELEEIHICCLDKLSGITSEKEKNLTIYISQLSNTFYENSKNTEGLFGEERPTDSFLENFKRVFLPKKDVRAFEDFINKNASDDVDLEILPLPEGYSFPAEALSEPWQQTGGNHDSGSKQPVLSGFNPFDQGDEKCKYVIHVNEAGEDKEAVTKTIMEICNCTKQKAKEFVDDLDDLLPDDEVCSVELEETAQSIKQQLMNAGASVSIWKREYEISLDETGNNKPRLAKAIMEIRNCDEKEAKELIDRADRNMLDTGINTVETLKEALSIKAQIEATGAKASISTSSCVIDEDDDDNDELEEETPSFDLDQVYGGSQYYCVLEGKSFGPVTIRQFANMARFGIVDKNTMVWKDGMTNWALAQTIADLQAVL